MVIKESIFYSFLNPITGRIFLTFNRLVVSYFHGAKAFCS